MQVIHILGLAHSGTTITDRILACFPGVIGLGEIEKMWLKVNRQNVDRAPCPCGQMPSTCPFWSRTVNQTFDTPQAFYAAVVEAARNTGHGWMIDTSKASLSLNTYTEMARSGDIQGLTQVRLIRDPRGWVGSMMRRNQIEDNDQEAVRNLFRRWFVNSLLLDVRVGDPAARTLYVWYDMVVIAAQQALLAEHLCLPTRESPIDLEQANQHAVAGNKFVFSKSRSSLSYDNRWMESGILDDIYSEMSGLRRYYHTLQTLHLTDNAVLTGLPPIADIRQQSGALVKSTPRPDLDDFLSAVKIVAGPSASAESSVQND